MLPKSVVLLIVLGFVLVITYLVFMLNFLMEKLLRLRSFSGGILVSKSISKELSLFRLFGFYLCAETVQIRKLLVSQSSFLMTTQC